MLGPHQRMFANTVVDLMTGQVREGEREGKLTGLELEVVRYLSDRPGQRVSRDVLEREVWEFSANVRSEAVPVGMRRLRKKLGQDALITVRARGWYLAAAATAPLRPTAPVATAPTPTLGREALLSELRAALDEGWRLVSLTGPGGVGKTRVGVELAVAWPGDALRVSLQDVRDAAGARNLVADALGLASGVDSAIESNLASRDRPLMLLDDGELVEGLRGLVEPWLERVPTLRLVITSRVALGSEAELVWTVPPLELTTAITLLTQRLRGHLSNPDPDAVHRLVTLLDRLPGALELYAGRAALGLTPLLAELEGQSTHPDLEASLNRSWQGLDAEARTLIVALSAFGGPFPEGAASAVTGGDLSGLAALRARSLLHLTDEGQLFLLSTVRRFCSQRDDAAAIRRPVHTWITGQAEGALATIQSDPASAHATLRSLRPHLLCAASDAEPDLAVLAAAQLAEALYYAGPETMGAEILAKIAHLHIPPQLRDRVDLWKAATLRRSGGAPEQVLAQLRELATPTATILRGHCHVSLGDREAALRLYDSVVHEVPEGDWRAASALLVTCSTACRVLLEEDEITRRLTRCLSLVDQHGHRRIRPSVLGRLAVEAGVSGDVRRARAMLARGIREAESHGPSRVLLDLWINLGIILFLTDLPGALAAFQRASSLGMNIGVPSSLPVSRANTLMVLFLLDRPEEVISQSVGDFGAYPEIALAMEAVRAASLISLGRGSEAQSTLDLLDWETLGRVFSRDGAGHGAALRRLVTAEAQVVRWRNDADPSARAALQEVLSSAAPETHVSRGLLLRGMCTRIERVLEAG